MDALWSLIVEDKREAAQAAVAAAFGKQAISTLEPLTGGISAKTYRIEVGRRAYALRIEGARGGLMDLERSYACMTAAAAAGLAPQVRHADPVQRVAITDFHAPRPLAEFPGGAAALAETLGRMVARLQAIPEFTAYGSYPVLIGRMFDFVRRSQLFQQGLLDGHAEAFGRLVGVYPWNEDEPVASHNDINPRNLIFDGSDLWLIDWETAFRNDRFVDLAILTTESAASPCLEDALMKGWLGHPPEQRERDRLAVMKPITRLYYVGLLLAPIAAAPLGEPVGDLTAPTVEAFTRAVQDGRLKIGTVELSIAFAKMLLEGFVGLAEAPETAAAMERLASDARE